eukprot:gene8959-6285_t
MRTDEQQQQQQHGYSKGEPSLNGPLEFFSFFVCLFVCVSLTVSSPNRLFYDTSSIYDDTWL